MHTQSLLKSVARIEIKIKCLPQSELLLCTAGGPRTVEEEGLGTKLAEAKGVHVGSPGQRSGAPWSWCPGWSGQSCLAFWLSLFSLETLGLFRSATLNNRADLMGGGHPGLHLLGL